MNLFLKIPLIISAALCSCNPTPKSAPGPIETGPVVVDTSNREIYDFMKEIIVSGNLVLTDPLEAEPQQNCDLNQPDNIYLNNFLIDSKRDSETIDPKTGNYSYPTDLFDRCLTKEDIHFMLSQKNANREFKWNSSRLGLTAGNNDLRYALSVPLFSRDRSKVIMMVRQLCPGLCGGGETVLFKKENNKWISKTIEGWWH